MRFPLAALSSSSGVGHFSQLTFHSVARCSISDDVQRMGGWEPVIKVLTLQGHHKEKNNERLLYSSDYHPTKLYYSKPGNIRVVRYTTGGTESCAMRPFSGCVVLRPQGRWTTGR